MYVEMGVCAECVCVIMAVTDSLRHLSAVISC